MTFQEKRTYAIPTCELGKAAVGRSPTSCEASTKLKKKLCYFLAPFYVLLCCATVYIQAHYLVDVIAGWISAVVCWDSYCWGIFQRRRGMLTPFWE